MGKRPNGRRASTTAASKPAVREPASSSFARRIEALGRSPLAFGIASALLLVPCLWQSRIQAGDLSSHIYNAWLAQLIESGKTTGLALAPQKTNVLTDLMLAWVFRAAGADVAQRVTVAVSVLVFVWGAFAFAWTISGRRPWSILPALAILAYGFTFHMGFLNFYLGLGLCLFGMAAAWTGRPKGVAAAVALFAIAYLAHGLAVGWAVGALAYSAIAARMGERGQALLTAAGIAAIGIARLELDRRTLTRWQGLQFLSMTGADQAWIYDSKYWAVVAGLFLVWLAWFVSLARQQGAHSLFSSIPFHVCLLTAAGVVILPTAIEIPGYKQLLTFISMRMSLALGVCYCAVLATARPPRFVRYLGIAVMLLHFGFIYRDSAVLNAYEDRMTAAVAQLQGKRVVIGINDTGVRANPFTHMIDRACLGVCYSYGNYEPSTDAFRVRAVAPNPFVAADYADAWRLENGLYVVKPRDVPIYRVDLEPDGSMVAREVPAGQRTGIADWDLLR